jgi:hypothetical protein
MRRGSCSVGAKGVELERLGPRLQCVVLGVALFAMGVVGSGCDFGRDSAKNSPTSNGHTAGTEVPEINSSLEGFAILPRRIQWTVTTSLPPERVKDVRFFVDETKLWTDPDSPFEYGEHGAQLGTWMGPGRHRFTVRVVGTDGARASETVTASVRWPKTDTPVIERKLWDIYARVSKAELKAPPPPNKSLHPTAWMWVRDPNEDRTLLVGRSFEQIFGYEYWVQGKTLYVGTAWSLGGPGAAYSLRGWHVTGTQCGAGAWPARYTWSNVRGRFLGRFNGEGIYARYLVLSAQEEPCAERHKLIEGVWANQGL